MKQPKKSPPLTPQEVAKRLRMGIDLGRARSGLPSLAKVARMAGLNIATVRRVGSKTKLSTLLAIADALGTDVPSLLVGFAKEERR